MNKPLNAASSGSRQGSGMTNGVLATTSLGPTIVVGEILCEIVANTVGNGFHEAQALTGPYPSGATAIFIDQCARLGCASAMIGAVGDDDFGRVNLNRLQADGVDISAINIDQEYPTGTAFVRYRSNGSRDFVYNIAKSAAARFIWNDKVRKLIESAGHIHIMGSALPMPPAVEIIDKAIPLIKARGGTVSVDPNLRKELKLEEATRQRFATWIAATDLLLPSGEELELAAGIAGEAEALAALFAKGVKEIVLKRGEKGATRFRPGSQRIDVASFKVKEIDPTGAGDCFGGAYVAASRLGLEAVQALTYGCAAGARNVTAIGPMEGAGTRSQLDDFIANTPRLT
jgi:tagatose kinase